MYHDFILWLYLVAVSFVLLLCIMTLYTYCYIVWLYLMATYYCYILWVCIMAMVYCVYQLLCCLALVIPPLEQTCFFHVVPENLRSQNPACNSCNPLTLTSVTVGNGGRCAVYHRIVPTSPYPYPPVESTLYSPTLGN